MSVSKLEGTAPQTEQLSCSDAPRSRLRASQTEMFRHSNLTASRIWAGRSPTCPHSGVGSRRSFGARFVSLRNLKTLAKVHWKLYRTFLHAHCTPAQAQSLLLSALESSFPASSTFGSPTISLTRAAMTYAGSPAMPARDDTPRSLSRPLAKANSPRRKSTEQRTREPRRTLRRRNEADRCAQTPPRGCCNWERGAAECRRGRGAPAPLLAGTLY